MEKTTGAVNLLNLTAQAGLANLPNIGTKVQSAGDTSFKDTFMKTSEVNPVEELKTDITVKKTVVENNKSALNTNIKSADNTTKENKESLDENKIKDVATEVTKAVDEIKDKIKNEFDVSDDDIEEAMEVLGLTNQNLFNETDLRSLVMELTETRDSIELLTNVELYDGIKEVTALAENLFSEVSEEFNLTTDDLAEIVNTDSFKEVLAEVNETEAETTEVVKPLTTVNDENATEDTVKASEKIVISENVEKTDNAEEIASKSEAVDETDKTVKTVTENGTSQVSDKTETKDEEPVEVKVEIEKSEGVRTSNPIETESFTKDNDSMSQNQGSKKENLFSNKNQEVNVANTQTVTTQTVNTVGDIVETVTSYSTYADTENIMRQVTDYVRVNITEDVTKMEMQLHPASLGTVNMQINSQNGQITAHLTVQNELVKSVLESQMIKLQETFNEQGTKVTSIEVTVAGYNLDAKSDNNYSQERENNQGGSKRRNINLNTIGSFDELTDEEQLEAEVMEMNGSSVNYTA